MTEGRNILVCGRTGCGKTYLVTRALEQSRRLLVYATKREEADYPGVYFDGLQPDERQRCWQWWAYSAGRCNKFRIVYHPANTWDVNEFDKWCKCVYQCGDMTFVAEEIMSYTTSFQLKSEQGVGFRTLLTAGRTRGCVCWLIAQRPHGIPVEVRSECREAYLFSMTHPGDIDYIKQAFGPEVAEQVAQLKQYEHVHWTEDGQHEVGKA
jgi:hypothetical protein